MKIKSFLAKSAATLAVGLVAVAGATHLLDSDRPDGFAAADIGNLTLISAQPGEFSTLATPVAQLPAAAFVPGKTLPANAKPAAVVLPTADCTASFGAVLMQGAMVRLTLNAPCDPATRVQIHHGGLTFDVLTDASGGVAVDVPALTPVAIFEADLAGLSRRTVVAIPDFESYVRVALQWQGQTGLQIHALEFGADIGSDGHVWADAPGTSLRAVRARGGFVTRLGDPALTDGRFAEIYVFPAGMMQRSGTVRLSIEAEVNAYSCGKTVEAQVLQPQGDGRMQRSALTLEIPGCDGIGDILVLKNLLRDMKIASN